MSKKIKPQPQQRQQIRFESATNLRRWLEENHQQTQSIWAVLWKKSSGRAMLTADQVAEECLCFGWIDSLPGKIDEQNYKLLISPRREKSNWSAVNRARVKKLIQENRMTPAGLAKIEVAKKNGSWTRLRDVEKLVIPKDLATALKNDLEMEKAFQNLAPSLRRGLLEKLLGAKSPATRQRRIREILELTAAKQRLIQQS